MTLMCAAEETFVDETLPVEFPTLQVETEILTQFAR